MKEKFTCSPLPFMGQKRRFIHQFEQTLNECFTDSNVIIDLFGGSGLLSHVARRALPNARIIYNDYDYFSQRIDNISATNVILQELRDALSSYPRHKTLNSDAKSKVLEIISNHAKNSEYVDYITLSSSLLFSMNYASDYEELAKQTMYNKLRREDYPIVKGYLDEIEIVHIDYRLLYHQYKDIPGVLFVLDPPYLNTKCDIYSGCWQLKDYLDVIKILSNVPYIYFTSNKSQIIELFEFLQDSYNIPNPFANACVRTVDQRIAINTTSYTDIMLYKKTALQEYCNAV